MDVRLPDGTVIKGVPDGMSKADLTAKLAKNGYDVSKLGAAPAADVNSIPGPAAFDPRAAGTPGYDATGHLIPARAPEPESQDNLLGKLVSPVDAGLSMLSGVAAAAIAPTAGFIKSAVRGGDPEKNASDIAQSIIRPPSTVTGAKLLDLAGTALAPLAALPSSAIADGARAAGSTVPLARMAGNVAERGITAAENAAGAAAAPVVRAAGNVARAVVPKIDPRTAELAAKAQQYDIPLRPDMLYKNRIAKMMGEASEKVPLSGSKAEPRQIAFNKAIIGTIGGDETAVRLTPDVFDKAIRTSGQKIGDIASRTPVTVDADLAQAIKGHVENAAKFETSDVAKVINSYVDELASKTENGVIQGEAFRKLNTKINTQLRNTSNGDLKHALSSLQDDMQDALQRGLRGDDLAMLKDARRQYAIAKTIEPLVAKSATGDISPAGLMGRVTSNNAGKSRMARGNGGDLGDLARIGQAFLKEPNSSGTAERTAAYGLLSGGALAQPATTAGVYGAANLYNRAGAAVARRLVKPNLRDLSGGTQ